MNMWFCTMKQSKCITFVKCRFHFPLEKGTYGHSLEQISILFTQGCLVPRFVEISQVVLDRRFLIFVNTCIYFRYFDIIAHWKKTWPFIWTNLNLLFNQGCYVLSLVKIGQVVLMKMKMCTVYRRTNRQTVDGWQVIRKAQLRCGKRILITTPT